MSSLMQAIEADIKAYLERCAVVGERPRWKDGSPDCYGEHSQQVDRLIHVVKKVRKAMGEQ